MADTIDLNTADRETLATLPGIGEALAERIVAFREEVHPFEEVIELAAVSGISERMVRNVEDRVTVSVAPAGDAAAPPEEALPSGVEEEPVAEEEPEEAAAGPEPVADESRQEEPEAVSIPAEAAAEAVEEPGGPGPPKEEPAPEEKTPVADTEAEAPRAVATAEAIEAAERATAAPQTAAESGRGWGCTLLGILAGAIAGASLTLFFLFLLNGTLLFGGRQQVADLEQEVLMQGRDQQGLDAEVADASAELATVVSAQETAAASQRSTADQVEELASDLDDLETDVVPAVATLEAQTAAQATRLSGIAAAAASFDAFLTRMRDLLIDLQGLPPTPTGTPSPSPSATAGTATPSATFPAADEAQTATPGGPTPTPTWTPRATRTPRPTATPIVRPTATPTD
ncbi:MAG: helix-hairpin-helix domain-containing protein [Candidatus Promineifilaceae bacterium]|nr:helix-hairpin-helix domain-containing protein [Candidatus Promineifilaceae bacterium]